MAQLVARAREAKSVGAFLNAEPANVPAEIRLRVKLKSSVVECLKYGGRDILQVLAGRRDFDPALPAGRSGAFLAASTSLANSCSVRARRGRRGSAWTLALGMRSNGLTPRRLARTHQLANDTSAV